MKISAVTTYEVATNDTEIVLEMKHNPRLDILDVTLRHTITSEEITFQMALDYKQLSEIEEAFSKMYYAQMAQDEIDEQ